MESGAENHTRQPVHSEECNTVKTGTMNQARTTALVGTYDFLYTLKQFVMMDSCVMSIGLRL